MEDSAARAARREHGKLIAVEVGGAQLRFRPLTLAEATRFARDTRLDPEDATELALALCEACCVAGDFAASSEAFPLAFAGADGVADALLKDAADSCAADIKSGIARWRGADRNLGQVAQSLLALKAYAGGPVDAATFAGALHVAEWLDTTKGLFRLVSSFMKALSKRGGRRG